MIRDITLGQYYPGESIVHRLDPRIKIIATIAYIVALFIADSFIGIATAAAAVFFAIAVSRVPISFLLRGLKPIFFIIIFTFVLNLFMGSGEVLVTLFWGLKITKNGLTTAVFMAVRLILLIMGSSLLTLTTKPISLTDGIESLLRPLKIFKVPAH